jgi:hypothetical protein
MWIKLILISFLLIGCDKNQKDEKIESVVFEEIDEPLANPMKGFVPWIGNNNPVFETKLKVATFPWNDIETSKGNYNWNNLEKNWGNIVETGERVGFRISAATPGVKGHIDIPQYLVDDGVQLREYLIDNSEGLAPDWDDQNFLEAHGKFIQALGDRYNDDPRVAWVDIGSYGFWGEWHVWMNESLAATEQTKLTILDQYFNAFPTKPMVIAFDDDLATQVVIDHGHGVRNDCLGTEDSNDWYETSMNSINPNVSNRVWKTSIVTGEFCGSNYGATQGTTVRFDLNFDFVKKHHWSWIGSAGGAISPVNDEHLNNLKKLHKTLGYRYVIKDFIYEDNAKVGSTLDFTIEIDNKGVAPFYLKWPTVIYLRDQDTNDEVFEELNIDIRGWLPGINTVFGKIDIPNNLIPGIYEIRIGIIDPLTNNPGIQFANTGNDGNNKYLLGRININ